MSKRSKDLFHLLEQREKEVRGDAGPSAAPRRAPGRTPGSVADRLRQWLGGTEVRGRGRRAANAAPPAAPFGLVVAAVGLGCLGAGFALGRFLPRADGNAELRAPSEEPRRPGPIESAPATASAALARADEEAELSSSFFHLMSFDRTEEERAQAARAAEFLRANGVATARLYKGRTERKVDGKAVSRELWAVVAYVTGEAAAEAVLGQLAAVPASRTWPALTQRIERLTLDDLYPKRRS